MAASRERDREICRDTERERAETAVAVAEDGELWPDVALANFTNINYDFISSQPAVLSTSFSLSISSSPSISPSLSLSFSHVYILRLCACGAT